ncbi:MAG: SDR family oxidoreductase [Planctomycetota bacterium]|nr:MAG: SDR family oxidoreductase [Planctomycetota bacterium]
MNLTHARMLVTGGSAGIGAAIAQSALERGARVVVNGRDEGRLEARAAELGAHAVAGDVGTDAEAIVAAATEHLGGLDVLVNNAGWGRRMSLEELDPDVFEAMWRTNVLGAAMMAKHALPHFRAAGRGAIVNIASTAAKRGYATGTAYTSTKFGLAAMTQCWQAELRPSDVRVIQINPSEVQTGFGGRDPERALDPKKLRSEDIAHATITALEMDDRGFIPELTIWATNPWSAEG